MSGFLSVIGFLLATVVFVAVYLALICGIGYAAVWFLTPVAYKRWRALKAKDEALGIR